MNKRFNKTNGATEKPDIKLTVKEDTELLKFLKEQLPQYSGSKVKSLLEHRSVSIDGVISTKYNAPLKEEQTVSISRAVPEFSKTKVSLDTPPIIYEDSEMLVINKPAGLLSIATDTEKENTAYHKMTEYVKLVHPDNRLFIVHRLDRETSGVLLFAKTEEMKYLLQDHWNELIACRGYVAVVEGNLKEKSGRIESYLRETDSHLVYSATRDNDGKLAITNYTVTRENEDYSMLKIELETGRKNQIRVHMKEHGHTVLGDKKYGSHKNPLKRLALHADRLEFTHPLTGELMKFKAPAPKSFGALFKNKAQHMSY